VIHLSRENLTRKRLRKREVRMRAIRLTAAGGPEALELEEIDVPEPVSATH